MVFGRLQTIRSLYRTLEVREFSPLYGSSRRYSNVIVNDLKYWRVSSRLYEHQNVVSQNVPETNCRGISSCLHKCNHGLPWTSRNTKELRSTMAAELYAFMGGMRLLSTQVKAPPQARQMGSFKVSMSSPGIIYEPYAPRERVPFWRRWFTRSGWKRTKEDIILELRSAYAIAKLRKSGYSKQKFYEEALNLYKEINTQISAGDKTSLRKAVTENMYSGLKNEIKQRESIWSKVYWELVEPVVKIRTLRARLISIDRNDLNKVFIQLTLEFLTKQKFEAYDSKGAVVAGDKNKEVLVRDIWVFEKSLFHPGAYWRLCGRLKV
ncbi:uncharacterized protein LOC130795900 [Actinidia eriantha]|uniref:uncharacterized protein LOC130795900 n=1 Tax=Actinidia eriantha TaxID=165200 RepID=UPI0025882F66|nr:uncharacterized protein LOC130795900 [Actinidia eriantha]